MSVVGAKRESRNQSKLKHTVFGYIRRHEVDGSVYVPKIIKSLCVEFYILEERFAAANTSALQLEEDGKMVHNFDPPGIRIGSCFEIQYLDTTGSVWIDTASQEISKCKWTLQIIYRRSIFYEHYDPLLCIGLGDGHHILHKIGITNCDLRSRKIDRSGERVESKLERHGLDSLDEVIMELDVENHTLNFTIYGAFTRTVCARVEMRDLPKARYHLWASLGRGHCLRLKDFSIEHRTCSKIPVIPRDVIPVIPCDVHFPCTHWIIRSLLVVLWVAVDYKLNRYFHEMGYLWPKIVLTAALAFVLGIRYGLNL